MNANPHPPVVYFSPAYTGKASADPKDYYVPTSHNPDLIGHTFLALDAAGLRYQEQPTPQYQAAYHGAVQSAADALAQTGALARLPEYQAWVKAAVSNGLVKMPTAPPQ